MELSLPSICFSKYPRALPLVFPSAGRISVLSAQINRLSSMKYKMSRWLHVTELHSDPQRTLQAKPILKLSPEADSMLTLSFLLLFFHVNCSCTLFSSILCISSKCEGEKCRKVWIVEGFLFQGLITHSYVGLVGARVTKKTRIC